MIYQTRTRLMHAEHPTDIGIGVLPPGLTVNLVSTNPA